MEFVGIVGSILQIAQVGAQLSLDLYKIAQSVGSAVKEVQYIAKDIALFSFILKDLGNTLSKGQTLRLYREDAYQAGVGIAKECEGFFEEIQDVLNKLNRNGGATPASTRRVDRLAVFRNNQGQLLRGKLEFLRSKILLQVAVLSYAERVSASPSSTPDIDGLLALKSLVLANETTKAAFRELRTKNTEGSSQGNPISISDDKITLVPKSSSPSGPQSSATAAHNFLSIAEILHDSTNESPMFGKKSSIPSPLPPAFRRRTYAGVWGTADRLELALRKVEIAEWEHERLQTILASNVKMETSTSAEWTEREKTYLMKFKRSLTRFGLSKEKIDQAIASVMTQHPSASMRTEVEQVVSQDDVLFATLHHFGASWQKDKNNADSRTVKRWIPSYLDDILWEKIYETYETTPDRQAEITSNVSDSLLLSDTEEPSSAQKRQAIQQAINQVCRSSMASEKLDDPKNSHHLLPETRQPGQLQSHLTVPMVGTMPRKAMNPARKASPVFSPLERQIFDTTLGAAQLNVEIDRSRSTRAIPSISMATTRPPALNIISEEDYSGVSDSYRTTDKTPRSFDDANPRRSANLSDRDDYSASKGTNNTSPYHQYDSPPRLSPSLLPSPDLKRKTQTPPSSTLQQYENFPRPTSTPKEPRQWFELEKHDKTSQTVHDLLRKWTFLDLGDQDTDERHDEQHSKKEDEEDRAQVGRARPGAGGAERERLERKGDTSGGGGERERGEGGQKRKKPRTS